jgi:hypothetical protein
MYNPADEEQINLDLMIRTVKARRELQAMGRIRPTSLSKKKDDSDDDNDDDDDFRDQGMKVCPTCGGTGQVPVDDDGEDNEEAQRKQRKARLYAFENEQ